MAASPVAFGDNMRVVHLDRVDNGAHPSGKVLHGSNPRGSIRFVGCSLHVDAATMHRGLRENPLDFDLTRTG